MPVSGALMDVTSTTQGPSPAPASPPLYSIHLQVPLSPAVPTPPFTPFSNRFSGQCHRDARPTLLSAPGAGTAP